MNVKQGKSRVSALGLVLLGVGLMFGVIACAPATGEVEDAPATEAPPQEPVVSETSAGPITVESSRPLLSVVDETDPWFTALSPDGAHLVYYKEGGRGQDTPQVCLYTFNNAAKKCYNLSRDLFAGYPYQFQWSPDSSMVAFSENPLELANESDIWLFKVVDGTFVNLTDDGQTGPWQQPTGTPSANIDYLPAWNPADSQIYFWRFVSLGEYLQFTLALYRVSPEGGEAELVRDLTQAIPQAVPVFKQEGFYLDGPAAISPDGRELAALFSTLDEFSETQTDLWLINLADTEAAPQELASTSAFSAAVPDWQAYPTYPTGLSWTAGGRGVLVIAQSEGPNTPFTVFYHVDVENGSITPVVDFSGLPDAEAYSEPAPGSDIPFRYFSPQTGSLSPQGNKLLMVNDLGGDWGLLVTGLPPDGTLPVVSAATEASTMFTASRSSRSADGKVLMYGLLLTVQE
jgi:hypothetical protein